MYMYMQVFIPPESIQIEHIDLSTRRRFKGVVAIQIHLRQANIANSTRLSRPASRGSIELFVSNTESYGSRFALESIEYAGGYAAKANCRNRTKRSLSLSKRSFAKVIYI